MPGRETDERAVLEFSVDRRERLVSRPRPSGSDARVWRGYEDISLTVWNSYRRNAAERDLPFDISIEEGWSVFLKQRRRCALTGLPISFSRTRRDGRSASIDRIDSTKGYCSGNVQWVHKLVNRLKGDLPESVFLSLCRLIAGWPSTPTF
jgi:hypothetical protein